VFSRSIASHVLTAMNLGDGCNGGVVQEFAVRAVVQLLEQRVHLLTVALAAQFQTEL
jgi:hypothetical protein